MASLIEESNMNDEVLNKGMERREVRGHWRTLPSGHVVYIPLHHRLQDIAESEIPTPRLEFNIERIGAGKFRFLVRRPGLYPTAEQQQEISEIYSTLKEFPGAEEDRIHGGVLLDIEKFNEIFSTLLDRVGPVAIDWASRRSIDRAFDDWEAGKLDDLRNEEAIQRAMRGWKCDLLLMTPAELDSLPYFTPKKKKHLKSLLGRPQHEWIQYHIDMVEKLQRKHELELRKNPELQKELFAKWQARLKDAMKKLFIRGFKEMMWAAAHSEELEALVKEDEETYTLLRELEANRQPILDAQNNADFKLPKETNRKVLNLTCKKCERKQKGEEDEEGALHCECPDGFEGVHDIRGYQKKGVNWLKTVRRGILAFDVGLGKTWTAATAARSLQLEGKVKGPAIVVAPATRKLGWYDDLKMLYPNSKIVVIHGGPNERKVLYRLAKQADFVIISYSAIQREAEKIMRLRPGVMINDESHRLKSWGNKTTKEYVENLSHIPYMFDLTATPMPNRPEELFSTMRRLNSNVLGDSLESFKNFYAYYEKFKDRGTGEKKERQVGYKNLDQLHDRLRPYMMVRTMYDEDVRVALPPKYKTTHKLDLHPDQVPFYEAALNDTLSAVIDFEDGKELSTDNILAQFTRLEQAAIDPGIIPGAEYPLFAEKGDKKTKVKTTSKYEQALDMINAAWASAKMRKVPPKGIAVYCHWNEVSTRFKELLIHNGVSPNEIADGVHARDEDMKDISDGFASGRYKILIAGDRMSEGLNLQGNADTMIHLDVPWVPKIVKQREGRIHRPGAKDPVSIFQLAVRGSMEEHKLMRLEQKEEAIRHVLSGAPEVTVESGKPRTMEEWLTVLGNGDKKRAQKWVEARRRGEWISVGSSKKEVEKKDRSGLVSDEPVDKTKRRRRERPELFNFEPTERVLGLDVKRRGVKRGKKRLEEEPTPKVKKGKKSKTGKKVKKGRPPIGRKIRGTKPVKKGTKPVKKGTKKSKKITASPKQAQKLLKLISAFEKAKSASKQKAILKQIQGLRKQIGA